MVAEPADSGGIQLLGDGIPNDPRIAQSTALIGRRMSVEHARVTIKSELSPGGGLGSSAAFSVALIRALASLSGQTLSIDQIDGIALESEQLFHGRPSGVDPHDHRARRHHPILEEGRRPGWNPSSRSDLSPSSSV